MESFPVLRCSSNPTAMQSFCSQHAVISASQNKDAPAGKTKSTPSSAPWEQGFLWTSWIFLSRSGPWAGCSATSSSRSTWCCAPCPSWTCSSSASSATTPSRRPWATCSCSRSAASAGSSPASGSSPSSWPSCPSWLESTPRARRFRIWRTRVRACLRQIRCTCCWWPFWLTSRRCSSCAWCTWGYFSSPGSRWSESILWWNAPLKCLTRRKRRTRDSHPTPKRRWRSPRSWWPSPFAGSRTSSSSRRDPSFPGRSTCTSTCSRCGSATWTACSTRSSTRSTRRSSDAPSVAFSCVADTTTTVAPTPPVRSLSDPKTDRFEPARLSDLHVIFLPWCCVAAVKFEMWDKTALPRHRHEECR